jgi:hypothetical protein
VTNCSTSGTDLLPVGCVGGTTAAAAIEGTVSGTVADAGSGAVVPEGDSA